jgi:hypothetical protein
VYTRALLFQDRPLRSAFYKLERGTRSQIEKDRDYHGERLKRKIKAGLNNIFQNNALPNKMKVVKPAIVDASLANTDFHESSLTFSDILAKRTPPWCLQNSSLLSSKTNKRTSIPKKATFSKTEFLENDVVNKNIIHRFFSGDNSDTDSEISEYDTLHGDGKQKEGLIAQRQGYLRPRLVRHLADQSDDEV